MNNKTENHIVKELELELLSPETRKSTKRLNELLADEIRTVGVRHRRSRGRADRRRDRRHPGDVPGGDGQRRPEGSRDGAHRQAGARIARAVRGAGRVF